MAKQDELNAIEDLNLYRPCRLYSVGAVASAIESLGVYAWDKYGRLVSNDDTKRDGLKVLTDYHDALMAAQTDANAESAVDYFWHDEGSPLERFLWPKGKYPDFEALHTQWLSNNSGAPQSQPTQERRKPALEKIIAALLVTAFPDEKDLIGNLNRERTDITEKIYNKLIKTGYSFNKKTLVERIKNLPLSGE